MSNKYCPSCGDPLNPGSNLCTCGWRGKSKDAPINLDPNHGLCAFVYMGERCKFPGTTSDSTRADSQTPFYCRFHAAVRDAGPEEIAKVNRLIATGQLKPATSDWRDDLINQVLAGRKAA